MKIPLVLLSGLLSDSTLWQHQIAHLQDIAAITAISSAQNSPQKMVQAILEQAPPLFCLAGHSMGGWLALEVMRHAPSRVLRLCLLNSTARPDSAEKAWRRKNMIRKVREGAFEEVVDAIVNRFVYNPQAVKQVKNMFMSQGKEAFIAQQEAMLMREDCLLLLPNIACPTRVVHAAQDQNFILEEQQELATLIPNAALSIIENCGHMSPMEQPEAVTAILRGDLVSIMGNTVS